MVASSSASHFRFPSVARFDNDPDYLVPRRFYASKKAKKGSGSGKKAGSIDDLLDVLSDDEDDDEVRGSSGKENLDAPDTAAAAFLVQWDKHASLKNVGKAKTGKGKQGHSNLAVDYHDVTHLTDLEGYWQDMEVILKKQKQFFVHHLHVRSTNALDDLLVELEGDEYPLKEVASINKKDPKRLVIDLTTFPQATPNVVQTLRASSLNLNPQQDGTRIYVSLPKVNREHRESVAKAAKSKFVETKDLMQSLQNKYLKKLDSAPSDAPKEHFKAVKELIMAIEHHFVKQADTDCHKKQQDLLNAK